MLPLEDLVNFLLLDAPGSMARRRQTRCTQRTTEGSRRATEIEGPSDVVAPSSGSFSPLRAADRVEELDAPDGDCEGRRFSALRQDVRSATISLLSVLFFDVAEPIEGLVEDPAFRRLLDEFLQVLAAVRSLRVAEI